VPVGGLLQDWDRHSPCEEGCGHDAHHPTNAPAITDDEIAAIDAWWRANNYLTIGQIYLQDNPLLRRELTSDDIKPRLLGHWAPARACLSSMRTSPA
jgi:phosphoketolase